MLELKLRPISSHMQLSSSFAIDIKYQVEFIEPPPFSLVSGNSVSDALIQLTVFADGVTNKFWEDDEQNAKFGEMVTTVYSPPRSLIDIHLWVHTPIFNVLMQLHQSNSLTQDICLGFDESTFILKEFESQPDEYQLMDVAAGVNIVNPSICWYLFNT
jgi:hypothetical protein